MKAFLLFAVLLAPTALLAQTPEVRIVRPGEIDDVQNALPSGFRRTLS